MIGKYPRAWILSVLATGVTLLLISSSVALAQGPDELPVIQLSVDSNTVTEDSGDTLVMITATLLSDVSLSSDVVVSVATVDYTTDVGIDYRGLPHGDVVIPIGNAFGSGFWNLIVIDDQDIEGTEVVSIVGSATGFEVIGTDLYILDDDISVSGSSAPFTIAGSTDSQNTDSDFGPSDITSSFSVADSQNEVAIQSVSSLTFPTLLASGCSDGTYVTDSDNNAGLVSDCEALIAIREHWISNPDNADLPLDHPLRTWGRSINLWKGVRIQDGRVSKLILRGRGLEYGIEGSIPDSIGDLTNLTYLLLSYNDLTGAIPGSIGDLTNLTYLYLNDNDLTGAIPGSIGDLTNLTYLYLNNNDLTDSIPDEFRGLSNLSDLFLYGNQLSGRIPSVIESLVNLERLALSDNQFSGSLPSWLGDLTRLRYLFITGNRLTGRIPPRLGNLRNLIRLYLGRNELSGPLPPELGRLSNLNVLNLYYNQLSGSIPSEWGNLTNLVTLDLRENSLSGDVPAEVKQLKNLRYIY